MAEIFISHATADKALARLLVDLLKEGIGVPGKSIFCSSIPGHGVPFAEDFNLYMKEQIKEPKLVFMLMTPAYLESAFCLMELGAAWSKSLTSLAIVVPPTSFDSVTKTLGLKQSWKIEDASGLIDLRSLVKQNVDTEERDDHTWEEKRAAWRHGLRKALKQLAPATKISASDHEAATATIAEQQAEIAALQDLLEKSEDKVAALMQTKDAASAKAALAALPGSVDTEKAFENLLDEVRSARPKHASDEVFKHILLDYFGKAAAINWYSVTKDEFERAFQYNLLSPDEGNPVQWKNTKLKALNSAIDDLVSFINDEDGHTWAEQQDEDVPTDPDDREFWEYHLEL